MTRESTLAVRRTLHLAWLRGPAPLVASIRPIQRCRSRNERRLRCGEDQRRDRGQYNASIEVTIRGARKFPGPPDALDIRRG